jgi:hypothetical protein
MATLTTGVPMGAIARLVEHYGCEVHDWLLRAEMIVRSTATRWQVRLHGFYDAGWTSVIAVGRDKSGREVILKALPETDRYRHERAALTHWDGLSVCRPHRHHRTHQPDIPPPRRLTNSDTRHHSKRHAPPPDRREQPRAGSIDMRPLSRPCEPIVLVESH